MKKIKKAIIPAAGLGTRFLPASKALPKEMLPIVDKPAIQFIVEEALKSGIEEILIITSRTKKAIEDHFDRSVELELELESKGKKKSLEMVRRISGMANINYVRQKESKGLGHAIGCARAFVSNEPFAVLLGDDIMTSARPALRQLLDVYEKTSSSVVGVQRVNKSEVSKYGIIDPAGSFENGYCKVRGLIEKPSIQSAPSDFAIMGRYIITPEFFDIIDTIGPGANGEIQLTDTLSSLLKSQDIFACSINGHRFDIGDKLGYLTAIVEYALSRSDLSDSFANYLAEISIDPDLPVRSAISQILRKSKS